MSFQQGISGLSAVSKNLDVIGNNIANASTVCAKTSRAEFVDMYAAALGSTSNKESGGGVAVQAVAQSFSQGGINTTNNPLDIAISGNGFFQVKSNDGTVHYTRNGQFKLNTEGEVVTNAGDRLMGYAADSSGNVQPGQSQPLKLQAAAIEPKGTAKVTIDANLDSRAQITQPAVPGIDFNDASTYNNATSVNAVDANGKSVVLTSYFQKTGAGTWDVYNTANGASITGTPATPTTTITFDPTGATMLTPVGAVSVNVPAGPVVSGVGTLPLTVSVAYAGFSQYAAPFGVTKLEQDGYASGVLSSIVVEPTGLIQANYSNGRTRAIGQIEIANFANMNGLQPIGNNGWARTIKSGEPVLGVPGAGNLGTLQASSLEESNVDLTGELVNMMIAQRSYQANAQTVKTQDQVLQTLLNMR